LGANSISFSEQYFVKVVGIKIFNSSIDAGDGKEASGAVGAVLRLLEGKFGMFGGPGKQTRKT